MATKERRTKAHAVKFTDGDWKRVQAAAAYHRMTPAAFVNEIVGDWLRGEGERWDGLLEQGRPEKKSTPQSKGV